MQIQEYMCQTALVTFVTDICYLFSRLVAEIGSWGVQMRSMVLTWPKRNHSSRLLPLATANRKTLVQKRRNRSSAAVSQHACAPLTALCVAYNKISMLSLFACVQPMFHYDHWSSSSLVILYIYICLIGSLLTCEHGMLMFSACMLMPYACTWQEQQHESLQEHGADHAMLQT